MHQNKNCIIDTEPLVLYILGQINPNLIGSFQKLKAYTIGNFNELTSFISKYESIYVTSYVWNEFSHHTLEHSLDDIDKKNLVVFLKTGRIGDICIKLNTIISNSRVYDLWFADISCYELAQDLDAPVITSDWKFTDFLRSNWVESYKFRAIVWFNEGALV